MSLEVILHRCEICGDLWETPEEAQTCETSHKAPVIIEGIEHGFQRFPEKLIVVIRDGNLELRQREYVPS